MHMLQKKNSPKNSARADYRGKTFEGHKGLGWPNMYQVLKKYYISIKILYLIELNNFSGNFQFPSDQKVFQNQFKNDKF